MLRVEALAFDERGNSVREKSFTEKSGEPTHGVKTKLLSTNEEPLVGPRLAHGTNPPLWCVVLYRLRPIQYNSLTKNKFTTQSWQWNARKRRKKILRSCDLGSVYTRNEAFWVCFPYSTHKKYAFSNATHRCLIVSNARTGMIMFLPKLARATPRSMRASTQGRWTSCLNWNSLMINNPIRPKSAPDAPTFVCKKETRTGWRF